MASDDVIARNPDYPSVMTTEEIKLTPKNIADILMFAVKSSYEAYDKRHNGEAWDQYWKEAEGSAPKHTKQFLKRYVFPDWEDIAEQNAIGITVLTSAEYWLATENGKIMLHYVNEALDEVARDIERLQHFETVLKFLRNMLEPQTPVEKANEVADILREAILELAEGDWRKIAAIIDRWSRDRNQ